MKSRLVSIPNTCKVRRTITISPSRKGRISKPQRTKPPKKKPLDLKVPARANSNEARNHCCLAQHSMPKGLTKLDASRTEKSNPPR